MASPSGADGYAPRSSSPDLPSVGEIVARYAKKPPLRSGSNAAPLPADAPTSFTTASALLRTQATSTEAQPLDTRRSQPKDTPQRPSTAREVIELSPDVSVVVPESLLTSGLDASPILLPIAGLDHDTKALDTTCPTTEPRKAPKSKSSKEPPEAPGTTAQAQAKVVKPPARKESAPSRRKKAETVSRHFASASAEGTASVKPVAPKSCRPKASKAPLKPTPAPLAPALAPTPVDDEVVCLEAALPRRSDWTPPRETAAHHPPSDSSDLRVVASPVDTQGASIPSSKAIFETLQDTFACPLPQPSSRSLSPEKDVPPVAVLKKRKVIQLIGPPREPSVPREAPPTKSKAPKKKPRTITELATAAYVAPASDGASEVSKTDSLRKVLEPGQGSDHVLQHGHPVSRPRKPDRTRKGKKGHCQLLLSPESAMDQSLRQDFLFGTSSQLAQEQSPTFIRDLQQALKASNELEEDPFASPQACTPKKGRKLWAAGARGEDGNLVDVEVIDLLDSPAFPEDPMAIVMAQMRKSASDDAEKEAPKTAPAIETSESDSDSDPFVAPKTSTQPKTILSLAQRRSSGPHPALHMVDPSISRLPTTPTVLLDEFASDDELPPSNQEAAQIRQQERQQKLAEGRQSAAPQPNFELMTDAQLSSQVAKYGFKAIKKRTAMVALLEQCWVSKTGGVPVAVGSAASISTTAAMAGPRPKISSAGVATSPTKKPRGRPRKDSSAAAATSDSASEVAVAAKPKRKSKKAAATSATSPKPRGRPKKSASPSSPRPRSRAKAASPSGSPSSKAKGVSASMPPPPKPKSRARTPTRGKKAATRAIVEIADSDGEDNLSGSSCSSPEHIFSSPTAANLSIGEDMDMSLVASLTTTARQSEVFGHITKAVKMAPRSGDPMNPSWHEKMLMYDPIVLEDFAAWLNSGQLDSVGFDGEVSSNEVKMWCESKSVCCLWRETTRGKERKRY